MATAKSADDARRSAISKKSKFKPAKPPVKPMTKTVISYDKATGLKVLRGGSKPLTQTNTQKAAMAEKAKTKTPAAKALIKRNMKAEARYAVIDIRNNRQGRLNDAMREAWQTDYKKPLTPAQIKAGNKAYEAEAKELKSRYAAAKRTAAAAARKAAAETTKANIIKYGPPKPFTSSGSRGGSAFAGSSSTKVGITYTK